MVFTVTVTANELILLWSSASNLFNDNLHLGCCVQDASGSQTSAASQVIEVKLPVALEKVLAFKGVRVSQVGMKPEDLERVEKGKILCVLFSCSCQLTTLITNACTRFNPKTVLRNIGNN